MSVRVHTKSGKPSGANALHSKQAGVLQRKCECGSHSAGGRCRECNRRAEGLLLRSVSGGTRFSEVPPVVNRVLNSPGQPLDGETRAFFEPRFDSDLSHVRLHVDEEASRSAHAVRAVAYTVGDHVALSGGPPSVNSSEGRRVLAHELVHTLQQKGNNSMPVAIGDPASEGEREADRLADQALSGRIARSAATVSDTPHVLSRIPIGGGPSPSTRLPSTSAPATTTATTTRPVPPRGTNPAACLESVCRLASQGAPTGDAEATQRVDDWERASIACVRADGPSSNASHQAQIVTNEVGEISADASSLRGSIGSLGRSPRRYLDLLDFIRESCTRKTQEVRIEFNYNVVFENPSGSTGWGYGSADWASIDDALSALPPEATWANPQLIRFSRSACHPRDLDSAGRCAGQPSGFGTSFIGGEAEPSSGRITIFNAGLGSAPASRSASLRLPATQQILRHEVGHIFMSQIPQAEQDRFFTQILPWKDFSWAWITSPAPRHPNWQADRDSLRSELGFTEAQLDTWLASLQPNTPVTVGARTYTRDTGTGGTSFFLSSVDPTQLPAGVEFEYARTSRGEYLAELYALAVSRPDFLHGALPQAQIEWLKRVVFRTPGSRDEWARQLAVGGDIDPGLFSRLLRVFTWEQARPIIDEILRQSSAPGDRGA